MNVNLVVFLANHCPSLGTLKRWWIARWESIRPARSSYSQHGEDAWILDRLKQLNLEGGIYVDVGANHPTRLSNTYLLYRNGLNGVVIEPNMELLGLHRLVRPRDRRVGVGCAASAALGAFQVASTPVLSTFSAAGFHDVGYTPRVLRIEYVPVLPLDSIIETLGVMWIYFLSIDTEGLDEAVLRGAAKTLERTLYVCVEANDPEDELHVSSALSGRFERVHQSGCNLIFKNRSQLHRVRTADDS